MHWRAFLQLLAHTTPPPSPLTWSCESRTGNFVHFFAAEAGHLDPQLCVCMTWSADTLLIAPLAEMPAACGFESTLGHASLRGNKQGLLS